MRFELLKAALEKKKHRIVKDTKSAGKAPLKIKIRQTKDKGDVVLGGSKDVVEEEASSRANEEVEVIGVESTRGSSVAPFSIRSSPVLSVREPKNNMEDMEEVQDEERVVGQRWSPGFVGDPIDGIHKGIYIYLFIHWF